MKKIKILNNSQKSDEVFENEINTLLSKGWEINGNFFKYERCLYLILVKNQLKNI